MRSQFVGCHHDEVCAYDVLTIVIATAVISVALVGSSLHLIFILWGEVSFVFFLWRILSPAPRTSTPYALRKL